MKTATSRSFVPTFGLSAWERSCERAVPQEKTRSLRSGRPLLAALLIAAAGALLVGGCVVAAWLGGILGFGAALIGFTAYLFVFRRGLDHLPVDWGSWRARNHNECHEATDDGNDRIEGGRT